MFVQWRKYMLTDDYFQGQLSGKVWNKSDSPVNDSLISPLHMSLFNISDIPQHFPPLNPLAFRMHQPQRPRNMPRSGQTIAPPRPSSDTWWKRGRIRIRGGLPGSKMLNKKRQTWLQLICFQNDRITIWCKNVQIYLKAMTWLRTVYGLSGSVHPSKAMSVGGECSRLF